MLNPTLSDLIGGIQSVTLGDEEARRRRTQKSVLERKAPPTFDVIVEIQDRERVAVHADVADTVDAMLRGDPVAPELRWRDEEGVHRIAGPAAAVAARAARRRAVRRPRRERARRGGWSPAGAARARTEAAATARPTAARAFRPGYRPGASGGWRQTRGGSGPRAGDPRARRGGWLRRAPLPGERFASPPALGRGAAGTSEAPFVAGDIADRGPLERGAPPTARRDARPRGARARAPEGLARPGQSGPSTR